jgi:hypothetical protein
LESLSEVKLWISSLYLRGEKPNRPKVFTLSIIYAEEFRLISMSRAIGFYGKFSPLSLCRPKDERSAIEQYRGEIKKLGQKERKKERKSNSFNTLY